MKSWKKKKKATEGDTICPLNTLLLPPYPMHGCLEHGDKLSNVNVNLRSSGTQITSHYDKSYHWVTAYHMPHAVLCAVFHILLISLWSTIIPILQTRKRWHRIKLLDQVDTANKGTRFQAQSVWLQSPWMYLLSGLGIMTDNTVKGRTPNLCQVPSTYYTGQTITVNSKIKNADFWSPGHPLTTLKAKDSDSECSL